MQVQTFNGRIAMNVLRIVRLTIATGKAIEDGLEQFEAGCFLFTR